MIGWWKEEAPLHDPKFVHAWRSYVHAEHPFKIYFPFRSYNDNHLGSLLGSLLDFFIGIWTRCGATSAHEPVQSEVCRSSTLIHSSVYTSQGMLSNLHCQSKSFLHLKMSHWQQCIPPDSRSLALLQVLSFKVKCKPFAPERSEVRSRASLFPVYYRSLLMVHHLSISNLNTYSSIYQYKYFSAL